MFKTIKSKFIIISITFVVFAVGIPLVFLVNQFRANFHQRSQIMLEATLDIFDNGLDNAMVLGKEKNVQQIVERIASNQNVDHIRIFNKDGIIKYSSHLYEIGQNILIAAPGHVNDDFDTTRNREVRVLDDFHAYSAFEPIINKPECRTCHNQEETIGYLDVDTHLTRAEITFYTGTIHLIFLGTAVIIILTLGLLYLFNRFINSPIKEFLGALYQVESGDLSARLTIKRKDEFGLLNSHFNDMVTEIQSSREQIVELHNEQLRHADKLVTIGELTAQMAHDINNYTGIILSRSDYLLLETERNKDLIQFARDIEVIQNEILKISTITKNVLRHSKKREVSLTNVQLEKIVKQSFNILEPILKKKDIIIIKEFNADKSTVHGDATELDQVFTNIFLNAVDAMENKGTLKVSIFNEDKSVIINIEDDGKGMEQSTITNIFSPFFTTKELDKGTGLGLYIVKNICERHQAKIVCESKLNFGTVFRIKFPLIGD